MQGGKPGFERIRIDPIRVMAGSLSTTLLSRMYPVRPAGVLSCYSSATVLVAAPPVVLPLTLLLPKLTTSPPFVACHPVPFAVTVDWPTRMTAAWSAAIPIALLLTVEFRTITAEELATDAVVIVAGNLIYDRNACTTHKPRSPPRFRTR